MATKAVLLETLAACAGFDPGLAVDCYIAHAATLQDDDAALIHKYVSVYASTMLTPGGGLRGMGEATYAAVAPVVAQIKARRSIRLADLDAAADLALRVCNH